MSTVRDFYNFLDEIAPFSAQESWDNSGFLVGDGCRRVEKVLVALDATEPVLDEAARIGAQLVITHHPVIFGSLKEFHPNNIAFLAAERGIAIISSHTSLDVADGGVNDCLAAALDLCNVRKCGDELGLLRVGELKFDAPLSCNKFVSYVAEKIGVGGIKYTPTEKPIKTVAVCGGVFPRRNGCRRGRICYRKYKAQFLYRYSQSGLLRFGRGAFLHRKYGYNPACGKAFGAFSGYRNRCFRIFVRPG